MDEKNTALVLRHERELTPSVWGMLKEMAPVMFTSRLFGVSSPEQATAIMLKGYELGLSVTASFEFIQVIEGKPTLSPRGALALIQAKSVLDDLNIKQIEENGKFFGVEVTMKRGCTEYTARFTLDDAKRAQLIEGSPTSQGKRGYGNWEKYPENMCLWRAVGFAADVVCPDITGGLTTYLKMPEAFDVDVDDKGNFIQPQPKVLDMPVITLNTLLAQYAPEEIMDANGGKIPSTDEEIEVIAKKLRAKKND